MGSNPIGFIENKGQVMNQNHLPNPAVKYLLSMKGVNVQVRQNGFSYDIYRAEINIPERRFPHEMPDQPEHSTIHVHRIDIAFPGSNSSPVIESENAGSAYYHYYTTNNPLVGDLPLKKFGQLTYKNLYPGIDLQLIASDRNDKPFEYNFIIHPGANASQIKIQYTGGNTKLTEGKVAITTLHGTLFEAIPLTYEREGGKEISAGYVELGHGVYGLKLGRYNAGKTVVVDPVPELSWATYLGGSESEIANKVTVDPFGFVYLAGATYSTNNIATSGAHQTSLSTAPDAFLAKFSATGVLVWCTYYGGTGDDQGSGVATDNLGNVYLTGWTSTSTGTALATSGSYQDVYGGGTFDAFLVKFTSGGTRLWGTYFGGSLEDRCIGGSVAVDLANNVYIGGRTLSTSGIATAGSHQSTHGGGTDGYMAKFNAAGALVWSTYIGGTLQDHVYALTVDNFGHVLPMVYTNSTNGIATSGTHQSSLSGTAYDASVVKFDSAGVRKWGTYYGGAGDEIFYGGATDLNGNFYGTGYTSAASTSGIATAGALQGAYGGGANDGMVAKFDTSGMLVWGTYLGGSGYDASSAIGVDNRGDVVVSFTSGSTNLSIATPDAPQTALGGSNDACVIKFDKNGVRKWATYYGGTADDRGIGVAINKNNGTVYLSGAIASAGLATPGAHQTTHGGGVSGRFGIPALIDAFVSVYEDLRPFNNAGIESLVSPKTFCAGNKQVTVRIKNFGANIIDSVWVGWELDATPQTAVLCRVRLDTAGGAGMNETDVVLDSAVSFFPNIAKVLKAWTYLPNNQIDSTNKDDSLIVTLKPALSGTYTIDPISIDYQNFSGAVSDLNNYGNCGPVHFYVTAGTTYNENPIILTRSGTAVDSIVFMKSGFGVNPKIFGINGNGTTDGIFTLNGVSFVTLDGIDLEDAATNSTTTTQMEYGYRIINASGIKGSSRNRIANSKIMLKRTNTASVGLLQSSLVNAPSSFTGANHENRYENIRVENAYSGIFLQGNPNFPDSNNSIKSVDSDSTIIGGSIAGDMGGSTILSQGITAQDQKNVLISGCVVRNITHTGTLLMSGIYINNISTNADFGKAKVVNNTVFGLSRTSTSVTGSITGIRMDVAIRAEALVVNNLVYGLTTANPTSATANILIRGIGHGVSSGTGNAAYYHNSINISNGSSTNASSAAFWKSGTGSVTTANNIFCNNTSAQSGTAKHFAYYVVTLPIAQSVSNILWAPNGNGFIGYAGADRNNLQVFAAATTATNPSNGNEAGSAVCDPNYSGTSDLTLLSPSPAATGGSWLSDTLTRFDMVGVTRNANSPTIGAFEQVLSLIDSSAPVITNVKITSGAIPVIYADIRDNSGGSAGNIRLWYRLGSSGTFAALPPDSIPSGGINGTYKWGTSFGSLAIGVYQFYIAARDNTFPGLNISVNPIQGTGFTGFDLGDPVNYLSNPDAAANTRNFAKTSLLAGGTYTVGATGTYPKLTDVANTLNSSTLTGNVVFELLSSYNGTTGETYPITFNQFLTSGGNWNVTIRPATGVSARETSGDPGSGIPMIRMNGADRINFDGRPGGSGNNLEWTLRNTRTAATFSAVFSMINDAQYDTIQYLKLQSQCTTTTNGIIEFLGTNETLGNDFHVVRFNEISDRTDVAGKPAIAIYSAGTPGATNNNISILDNKLVNWTSTGILITATGNGSNWRIMRNSFYMTSAATTAQTSIRFEPGSGSTGNILSQNYIGGSAPLAAGSTWTNSVAGLWRGIVCNGSISDSTYITSNIIQNLQLTGGTGTFSAIECIGGLWSIRSNQIGSASVSNSIQSSQLGTIISIWFNNAGNSGRIYDNTIANITSTGSTTAVGHNAIRITTASTTQPLFINGNNIFNLSADNPTVSGTTPSMAGIVSLFAGTQQTISKNRIYNLVSGITANAALHVIGINVSNAASAGTITQNYISGLRTPTTNPGAMIMGIQLDAGGIWNIHNNMISLGHNSDSSATLIGINDKVAANQIQLVHNTVWINGNAVSPLSTLSTAYRRLASGTVVVRNNIFRNSRTGFGSHYALINTSPTPATGWTSNYNALHTVNVSELGLWGTIATNYSGWLATSLQDADSKNLAGSFVSVSDLHLAAPSIGDTNLAGTPLANVAVDFDGEARSPFTPYMGADENIANPLPLGLVHFTASKSGKAVRLDWATSYEKNTAMFVIEKSVDGRHFQTIGSVKSSYNASAVVKYFFVDTDWNPENVPVIYYRLKCLDRDGTFTFSKQVWINRENSVAFLIYPNPVGNFLQIQTEYPGKCSIHNELGQLVKVIELTANKTQTVNIEDLEMGTYYLVLEGNNQKEVRKMLVVR